MNKIKAQFYQFDRDKNFVFGFESSDESAKTITEENIICWLSIHLFKYSLSDFFIFKLNRPIYIELELNKQTFYYKVNRFTNDTVKNKCLVSFPLKNSKSLYYVSKSRNYPNAPEVSGGGKLPINPDIGFKSEKVFNTIEFSSLKKGQSFGPIIYNRNGPKS